MPKKRLKPEQVVTLLRQIEVAVANRKTTPQACKEAEVTERTYYRRRKEHGGLKLDPARRRCRVARSGRCGSGGAAIERRNGTV